MTEISCNITQRHDFCSKSPTRDIEDEALNMEKPLLDVNYKLNIAK